MGSLFDNANAQYTLMDIDPQGGDHSADPNDYWMFTDEDVFDDAVLVRLNHPYVTVTGLVVIAPRVLKERPALGDLRRIHRARASLRQAAKTRLDTSTTMTQEESSGEIRNV